MAARVMHSFGPRSDRENPYLWLLEGALAEAGVESDRFSWSGAFRGRYDVLHVHWPEYLVRGASRFDRGRRALLLGALVARLRLGRRPVVRTVHNAQPHEAGGPIERWALRLLDRRTTAWIHLTPPAGGARPPAFYAPIGDYGAATAEHPRAESEPGRLVFFGQVRRYKNVPELVRRVRELDDPAVHVDVLGAPSHVQLEQEVRAAAGDDPRVSLVLRHLEEGELVRAITCGRLVVLPYTRLLNSGALITALSLGRPVLVPETPSTLAIRDEVGEDWVLTYRGPLTAEVLRHATGRLSGELPAAAPDLSARAWPAVARQHVEAYRWALGRSPRR